MSINKVILIGNVGKDPEIRYLENGTPVTTITLATSEYYTNKNGERVSNTEWHNVVLWRNLAEIAQKYVKKGSQIFIEGKIRSRSWDDKDGNKKYITEIIADNMQLLGRKPDDSQSSASHEPAKSVVENDSVSIASEPTDDLPF